MFNIRCSLKFVLISLVSCYKEEKKSQGQEVETRRPSLLAPREAGANASPLQDSGAAGANLKLAALGSSVRTDALRAAEVPTCSSDNPLTNRAPSSGHLTEPLSRQRWRQRAALTYFPPLLLRGQTEVKEETFPRVAASPQLSNHHHPPPPPAMQEEEEEEGARIT